MVVVTAGQHYRLPLLVVVAPFRREIPIQRRPNPVTISGSGDDRMREAKIRYRSEARD